MDPVEEFADFFPAKPLGCYGDGGAIFTEDDELAAKLRSLRVHGKGHDKYDNVEIGMNGRLDTLQAAILLEKLAVFEEEIAARDQVARRYTETLHQAVQTPALPDEVTSVWAQYTIRLFHGSRDSVAARLKEYWSDDDIVEIMAVIALFGYLNRWNDSMGSALEDLPIEAGEKYLAEQGWEIGKHQ